MSDIIPGCRERTNFIFQHKLISMHVQLCVSGLIVLSEHYVIVLHSVLNIHYAVAHRIIR